MAKIKGWTKLDVDIYRKDERDLFRNYHYYWIDARNSVRAVDSLFKVDKLPVQLIERSEVMWRNKTGVEARKSLFKYMRELS